MNFTSILIFIISVLAILVIYTCVKKFKFKKQLNKIDTFLLSMFVGALIGLLGYRLLS